MSKGKSCGGKSRGGSHPQTGFPQKQVASLAAVEAMRPQSPVAVSHLQKETNKL